MINLPRSVASVWTSNPKVADVYVNSPRQMNLFGKDDGEATVIATAADGSVVYGAKVRVSQNISSINEMLRQAMPESDITRRQRRPDRGPQRHRRFARRRGPGRACWSRRRSIRASTSSKDGATLQDRAGQPAQGRDAAAGDAEGQIAEVSRDAPEADRRQPAVDATRPAASSSASARAIPASAVPGADRPDVRPAADGLQQSSAARRSALPASCSASTCSARSISRRPTASSRCSPSRTSPRFRAKPRASSPAANSRSRCRSRSAR